MVVPVAEASSFELDTLSPIDIRCQVCNYGWLMPAPYSSGKPEPPSWLHCFCARHVMRDLQRYLAELEKQQGITNDQGNENHQEAKEP